MIKDFNDFDDDDFADENFEDYDPITIKEFEIEAAKTAIYPVSGTLTGLLYTALGLAGEAGEVANKVKKALRDDGGELTEERKQAISEELGDCLWYLARLAAEIGTTLEDVALENVGKLRARQQTGTLHGDGDKR